MKNARRAALPAAPAFFEERLSIMPRTFGMALDHRLYVGAWDRLAQLRRSAFPCHSKCFTLSRRLKTSAPVCGCSCCSALVC